MKANTLALCSTLVLNGCSQTPEPTPLNFAKLTNCHAMQISNLLSSNENFEYLEGIFDPATQARFKEKEEQAKIECNTQNGNSIKNNLNIISSLTEDDFNKLTSSDLFNSLQTLIYTGLNNTSYHQRIIFLIRKNILSEDLLIQIIQDSYQKQINNQGTAKLLVIYLQEKEQTLSKLYEILFKIFHNNVPTNFLQEVVKQNPKLLNLTNNLNTDTEKHLAGIINNIEFFIKAGFNFDNFLQQNPLVALYYLPKNKRSTVINNITQNILDYIDQDPDFDPNATLKINNREFTSVFTAINLENNKLLQILIKKGVKVEEVFSLQQQDHTQDEILTFNNLDLATTLMPAMTPNGVERIQILLKYIQPTIQNIADIIDLYKDTVVENDISIYHPENTQQSVLQIITALLEKGINLNQIINQTTLLHDVIHLEIQERKYNITSPIGLQILKVLLQHGISANIKDRNQYSAYDYALRNNLNHISEVLEKQDAEFTYQSAIAVFVAKNKKYEEKAAEYLIININNFSIEELDELLRFYQYLPAHIVKIIEQQGAVLIKMEK